MIKSLLYPLLLLTLMLIYSCNKQTVSTDVLEQLALHNLVNKNNTDNYNELIQQFIVYNEQFKNRAVDILSKPAKTDATAFIGSSTFNMWDNLEAEFDSVKAINRAISGTTIKEMIHYSEALLFAIKPKIVVVYIGDNDIYKFTVEQFKGYLKCFVDNFRRRLPNTPLVFISVKPSPSRKEKFNYYIQINANYQAISNNDEMIHYISIWDELYQHPQQYFSNDQLHLNAQGYAILLKNLKPLLLKLF